MTLTVVIGILVVIIIALMIYNIVISRKIKTYKDINQKVTSLNVLQEFMNTARK